MTELGGPVMTEMGDEALWDTWLLQVRRGESTTTTLWASHGPAQCRGEVCCLHAPSSHPLAGANMVWRSDRGGMMERICRHGVGHPDPDDLAYKQRTLPADRYAELGFEDHECDGCCGGRGPA